MEKETPFKGNQGSTPLRTASHNRHIHWGVLFL